MALPSYANRSNASGLAALDLMMIEELAGVEFSPGSRIGGSAAALKEPRLDSDAVSSRLRNAS
jgi:hypothetical protein